MENKITLAIIILVALLGAAFYWFEWRPTQIIKSCDESSYYMSDRDNFYRNCLREHGFKK